MKQQQELMKQIDALFHPRSIAIVGVPRGMKTGKIFLIALLDQGFPGAIYPVNPGAKEIDGLKAYPRVSDIPEPVDLAIILVPQQHSLQVLRECAAKGVKGAVLFTSGFSETGTDSGKALEAEMVSIARAAGMRLIGPNGMGLYSPETGLSFFPQLSTEPGPVGMISHSGSLTNILGRIAEDNGIRFSKVISSGNECDLIAADFLSYLANDPATRVIGAYLEGIKNGPYFLEVLQETSLQKPVIIWKVGLTPEGSRAANSHTGALAGSQRIWRAIVQQTGAIPVYGFEPMVDALMGFSMLPAEIGSRIAIISGPGGLAVSAAEACGREGLKLAELSLQTRSKLSEFIPATGTSLNNPVDVSLTAHFDTAIFEQTARIVAADPGVDALIIIGSGLTPELNLEYAKQLALVADDCQKPLLLVKIPGAEYTNKHDLYRSGIPLFDTVERAIHTYALAYGYQRWRKKRI